MRKLFNSVTVIFCALALCAAALAGCGSGSGAAGFGIVTAGDASAASAPLAELSAGMENYVAETGLTSGTYAAAEYSEEAIAEQFKAASEAGVRYVICCGEEMEIPVYAAQNEYHGMRFLLFDGEPRKSADTEAQIRKNTECITFNKGELGFLAGYTAIREGYRNVSWISGVNEGESAEYYTGFLRGVGYAINELMINSADVTVNAEFAGSDALTPRRTADALNLYGEGTELVLTDRPEIARAVSLAAAQAGRYIATVGFDGSAYLDRVQYAAVGSYSDAVQKILDACIKDNGFQGGSTVACGAAENGIRIAADFAGFSSVSEDTVRTLLSAMAAGSYGTETGTDTESGESEGGESADSGTGLESVVNVREVAPSEPGDTDGSAFAAVTPAAQATAEEGTETADASSDGTAAAPEESGEAEETGTEETTAEETDTEETAAEETDTEEAGAEETDTEEADAE